MKDLETITTIQELLQGRNEDFDRAASENKVKLVRHSTDKDETDIHGEHINPFSLYDIYLHKPNLFMDYVREQNSQIYKGSEYIVMFIGEPYNNAGRFIGVYKNNGHHPSSYKYARYIYDVVEVEGFEILKEKVVIEWKVGKCYHININTKELPVIRIDYGIGDKRIPHFKSYEEVNLPYQTLRTIVRNGYEEWKKPLTAVNCIYMIVDQSNGMKYIGSTYNRQGIWGRWSQYAINGTGDDKMLNELIKEHPKYAQKFNWIILETLRLNITDDEAINRESMYKEKFLTRFPFGYNKN